MKKVYIITCTPQASKLCDFTLSQIEFVFTSKKQAHKQLDIIKEYVENGRWWTNTDGDKLHGKVLSDYTSKKVTSLGFIRDILIETPNGLREVFRLAERELNSGFGMI